MLPSRAQLFVTLASWATTCGIILNIPVSLYKDYSYTLCNNNSDEICYPDNNNTDRFSKVQDTFVTFSTSLILITIFGILSTFCIKHSWNSRFSILTLFSFISLITITILDYYNIQPWIVLVSVFSIPIYLNVAVTMSIILGLLQYLPDINPINFLVICLHIGGILTSSVQAIDIALNNSYLILLTMLIFFINLIGYIISFTNATCWMSVVDTKEYNNMPTKSHIELVSKVYKYSTTDIKRIRRIYDNKVGRWDRAQQFVTLYGLLSTVLCLNTIINWSSFPLINMNTKSQIVDWVDHKYYYTFSTISFHICVIIGNLACVKDSKCFNLITLFVFTIIRGILHFLLVIIAPKIISCRGHERLYVGLLLIDGGIFGYLSRMVIHKLSKDVNLLYSIIIWYFYIFSILIGLQISMMIIFTV